MTITLAQLAGHLRVGDGTTEPTGPVGLVLTRVLAAAVAVVEHHAPNAPEAIQNEAAVRLAGWLYDSDPAGANPGGPQGLRASGAGSLLGPWRAPSAGAVRGGVD